MSAGPSILILGLGNSLLGDDAAGPNAVERLMASPLARDRQVSLRDGGTMGLSLLPEIEDCRGFIAIDAASFGAAPGAVRVFEGAAMDAILGGVKKTAHEVALADLMGAALLAGSAPVFRALVAVQPLTTALGMTLSPPVAAAMPQVLSETLALVRRWRSAMEQDAAAHLETTE